MELQFHDVAKRYGAKEALRGIDLTLTPGVYGLLGPNGAGKSTLMNILTGNLRPTRGHVTLDGEDTVSMGEAFRRRLGYCPQQQALYPGFTGEQFLYYMASRMEPLVGTSGSSTWCSLAAAMASSPDFQSLKSTPEYFLTASTMVRRSQWPMSICLP